MRDGSKNCFNVLILALMVLGGLGSLGEEAIPAEKAAEGSAPASAEEDGADPEGDVAPPEDETAEISAEDDPPVPDPEKEEAVEDVPSAIDLLEDEPAEVDGEETPPIGDESGPIAESDDIESGDPAPVPLPEGGEEGVEINGNGLLAAINAGAGPGAVEGEVFDEESGEGLPGAFVSVPALDFRVRTDDQGRYSIKGLPLGPVILKFTKSGYLSAESEVEVGNPDEPLTVSKGLEVRPVELDDSEYLLEDYEFVAEYEEESFGGIQLASAETPQLVSGIGELEFAEQAVSDAADAVGKVSGANIVDGKFAVVRGLADRYVTTTFNGGAVASAVPDRKAIQLDLFPTSVIRSIDVAKTYDPSLIGDFGGAAIDIKSKLFPDESFLKFKLKSSYLEELPNEMLVMGDQDLGFLGEVARTIDVGELLVVDPSTGGLRLPQGVLVFPANGTPEQQAAAQMRIDQALISWNELHATRDLVPVADNAQQPLSFGLSMGHTMEVGAGKRLGVILAASQSSGDSYNETPRTNALPTAIWDEEAFQRAAEWTLYGSIGLEIGDFTTLQASYFRQHVGEQNVTVGSNLRDPNGLGFGNTDNFGAVENVYGVAGDLVGNFIEIDPVERDMEIIQLGGEHKVGGSDRSPTLTWSFTDATAKEERPDTSVFRYSTIDFGADRLSAFNDRRLGQVIDLFEAGLGLSERPANLDELRTVADSFGIPQSIVDQQLANAGFLQLDPNMESVDTIALLPFRGGSTAGTGNTTVRSLQTVEEFSEDGSLALEVPFFFDDDSEERGFTLGIGGGHNERMRKNRGLIFNLNVERQNDANTTAEGIPVNDLLGIVPGTDLTLGEFLVQNPGRISDYFTGVTTTGAFYGDASVGTGNLLGQVLNNVDAVHEISGMFISGNLFYDDWYVRGGVRYESEIRSAEYLDPRPLQLPEELDPPPTLEEEVFLPSITVGTRLFDAVDLTAAWSRTVSRPTFYEWVPTRSLELTTGLVRNGNPLLQNASITNYDLAASYSFDDDSLIRLGLFRKVITDPIVELRGQVSDAPAINYDNGIEGIIQGVELEGEIDLFGPFDLKSNLTYIDAELSYLDSLEAEVLRERFPYQPELIFNLNLGYLSEDESFGANLIYNYTGEYLTTIRTDTTDSNLSLNPLHSLDLVVKKDFEWPSGDVLTLSAGVKNLIATDKEFTFSGGGSDGTVFRREDREKAYFFEASMEF